DAVEQLKAIERPFLNWAGKAERLSFDVPTLPLFVHERLSTKAIVETLTEHKRASDQMDLFGDPQHSIVGQSQGEGDHPPLQRRRSERGEGEAQWSAAQP